jgi:tRNA(fMet)-specific endonuclease VapC
LKYLLDTDHISVLQQQSGAEYVALSGRIAQSPADDLSLSIVSFHEQALGCHAYISRARGPADLLRGYGMLQRLLSDYSAVAVLPFDSNAATTFAGLAALRIRVPTMDLRIASVALSAGLTLVTRNTGDFSKVPGLVIEDWTI